MTIRKIFIVVPSPHPAGPVKGAYALANALAAERDVTLVSLKSGPGASAVLDERVATVSLADHDSGWRGRADVLRAMFGKAGGRKRVASISYCLSADMVNRFCAKQAIICSSVRGNLVRNYRMDYGLLGVPLAMGHLAALRRFDHVVAMTGAMARQVSRYTGRLPAVIGNFVDEPALEGYRVAGTGEGPLRFAFLGALSHRKQPLLLVRALHSLLQKGVAAHLDLIGDGPIREQVANEVVRLSLGGNVTLHGHLADPYSILAAADAMILPSLSEGVSRAVLEALHLGVPCVLREVDGNGELFGDGRTGVLFHRDEEVANAMLSAAKMGRAAPRRESLLPAAFRQQDAARRYLELVEKN